MKTIKPDTEIAILWSVIAIRMLKELVTAPFSGNCADILRSAFTAIIALVTIARIYKAIHPHRNPPTP